MQGCATRADFFVVYRVVSHLSHRTAGRLDVAATACSQAAPRAVLRKSVWEIHPVTSPVSGFR